MNNLRIGIRLGVGFAVVLALLIAAGSVALFELKNVKEDLENIAEREVKALDRVGDLALRAGDEDRLIRSAVLYDNPERRERVLADLQTAMDGSLPVLEELRELLEVQGRGEMLKGVGSALSFYHRQQQDVVSELRRGASQRVVADLVEDNIRPAGQDLRAELAAAREDVGAAIQRSADRAYSAYETSWVVLMSIIIASVVIGTILAIWLTRGIVVPVNEAVEAARAVARGDLTGKLRSARKDETGMLLNALADMRDSLKDIVSNIREGVDTINTAAGEVATGNTDLSQRTEEQASSLEQTAASMEELTSTVKQNAENSRHANSLASAASENADRGGDVVDDVVKRMSEIKEGSRKMSEIISVIDGIAFQTNILALNAAVEAARAGEQGRGFAVVATEVRSLAQRSASAAKEIKSLIESSVDNINTGSDLADKAGTAMEEIVASIKKVTDIIGEISAASDEQSAGIEQINQAVSQMDQVTQQNAALVEESAAAAESLQSQAEELETSVSSFQLDESGRARKPAPAKAAERRPAQSAAPARPGPENRKAVTSKPAPAKGEEGDDWEEF
jgi:methyl-accepting chemotaxis protein